MSIRASICLLFSDVQPTDSTIFGRPITPEAVFNKQSTLVVKIATVERRLPNFLSLSSIFVIIINIINLAREITSKIKILKH